MLAEAVGLGLLVILDRLEPAERLAFVLHDIFGMSFDGIAPILARSTVATRQLASRARRRVHGERREPSAYVRGSAAPFVFACLTVASWWLRPEDRRLASAPEPRIARAIAQTREA